MSVSDWKPIKLMNTVQKKDAIKKRAQDSDAWLIKQTPLQLERSEYSNAGGQQVSRMSYTHPDTSLQKQNESKQRIMTIESDHENEEVADIDEQYVRSIQQLEKDNNIEYIINQTCIKHFKEINQKIDKIIEQQKILKTDLDQFKQQTGERESKNYKKLNEKLKLMFENQTSLDIVIQKIQQIDIVELQSKLSELAGFINASVVQNVK